MNNELAIDSSRSLSNFIYFNKIRQMPYDQANEEYKKTQSFNSIDLNPSYQEQIDNSADDHLLEHLRSSNLLKRKSYLIASHLINNQLLTEEDYTSDFNRTDVGTVVFDKILLKNQKILNKEVTAMSKSKYKRLNYWKKNFLRSCSCSELSDSMLSHYPATNDFCYEKKNSNYLDSLNLDQPNVIYSSLAFLNKKVSNLNEYNKNVVQMRDTLKSSSRKVVIIETRKKFPKTSTRKPCKTHVKNLKHKYTFKKFRKPTKVVKWDSIQPANKNINSNSDRNDLSKWVDWRTKLNDDLITNQASVNSLRIEKNISFSVINYMKKESNLHDFIIYGIPKINLSTESIEQNKLKDSFSLKNNLKLIKNESISSISTIRLNKIPGNNVREKIKAFERVASSSNSNKSSKSKISSSDNKNQSSRSYSISSFSTTTTGLNRESSTASSNKSCTTSTSLTTSNFTTSDSTLTEKKKMNKSKENKETQEHVYYNDNEKPPPKPCRKIPLSKLRKFSNTSNDNQVNQATSTVVANSKVPLEAFCKKSFKSPVTRLSFFFSLFHCTKNSFKRTKAYIREVLFKKEHYDYLLPSSFFRSKSEKNVRKYCSSNMSHDYVNVNNAANKNRDKKLRKKRKPNGKGSLSSSSVELNEKKADNRKKIIKKHKIENIKPCKNGNKLVNELNNHGMKKNAVSFDSRSLKKPPLPPPPPPPPPLTPFLKHQKLLKERCKLIFQPNSQKTKVDRNINLKSTNKYGLIYNNEAYLAISKLENKKMLHSNTNSTDEFVVSQTERKVETKSEFANRLAQNKKCKTSREILKELSQINGYL